MSHSSQVPPFRRLVGLLRPELPDIRAIVILAVGIALFGIATPIAIEALVNTVAFGNLYQPVVVLAGLLLLCLGAIASLQSLQVYLAEILQRRVFVRMLGLIAGVLPETRVDEFDSRSGPELVNRFLDIATVQKVVPALLIDGLSIVLTTLVSMVVLAFYHPYLLGYDLVLAAALFLLIWVLGRNAAQTAIEESVAKYRATAWLQELARVPETFKGSQAQHWALAQADILAHEYLEARTDHFRILFRQVVCGFGLQAVASVALLGLGGFLVIRRELTLGQLVAAEFLITAILGAVAKLGKHLDSFYDLMAAIDKLGMLLDLATEQRGSETLKRQQGPLALRARDLSFAYPGGPLLWKGVGFDLAPGQRLAIRGQSGTGKTTLAEVLYGLRRPLSGAVEVDRVDLRTLESGSWRRRAALVQDTAVVAYQSILDNLRLGRAELEIEQIQEVLERFGLWAPIADLPQGLQTILQPTGAPLSDGQRRMLCLARACIAQPGLLVVDEVLDLLDDRSFELAAVELLRPNPPWTLVLVTRRAALWERCDQLLDISSGEVG